MESFIESSALTVRQKAAVSSRYIPIARRERRKYHGAAAAYWILTIYNICASAFMAAYPSALSGESVMAATIIGASIPVALTLLASLKIPTLYTSYGEAAEKMEILIWDLGETGDFTKFRAEFEAVISRRRSLINEEMNLSRNIDEGNPEE